MYVLRTDRVQFSDRNCSTPWIFVVVRFVAMPKRPWTAFDDRILFFIFTLKTIVLGRVNHLCGGHGGVGGGYALNVHNKRRISGEGMRKKTCLFFSNLASKYDAQENRF